MLPTFIRTDPQFTEMQYQFMEDHYHHFEDKDENKFVYTEIFAKYVSVRCKFTPLLHPFSSCNDPFPDKVNREIHRQRIVHEN